jgi:hypothetical protein
MPSFSIPMRCRPSDICPLMLRPCISIS